MKKVAVLRSNKLRHKALTASLRQSGLDVFDVQFEDASMTSGLKETPLVLRHFDARNQTEHDFFSGLVRATQPETNSYSEEMLNSPELVDLVVKYAPDYVVTFGCGLLRRIWLDAFHDQILGIHLGLSPYYRGSGTNFFPIVRGELGAVGFSLMNLDAGIDTGAIVHQRRAHICLGDSIHSIGTRVIAQMFGDIAKIVHTSIDLGLAIPQPQSSSRVYRTRDFNEGVLRLAMMNLCDGLIERYLDNIVDENLKFPLVQQLDL